jgi:hypothetical protein
MVFIELVGKDKRVCFARGQISQTCLLLKTISGKDWDKWWRGAADGCPSQFAYRY